MKKSLIALAVAGAFASPAFAATSNVDVYGIMSFAIEDGNNQDANVIDRVSRIGFKGSEDLGGGLKAIWQIEQQISATSSTSGAFGGASLRNTYVGLAGGFGTVLMGRHDTPYKIATGKLDPFADTLADYNGGGVLNLGYINGAHDYRSPQTVAYISPSFGGLSFAAAAVSGSNSELDKTSSYKTSDGIDGVSAAVMYDNGPLFASLAYQKVDRAGMKAMTDPVNALNASMNVGMPIVGSPTPSDTLYSASVAVGGSTAWKAGVGYAFGGLKLGALYEQTKSDVTATINTWQLGVVSSDAGEVKTKTYGLNAVYQMGAVALKGAYMRMNVKASDLDIDADAKRWILGADYSLSKRTTAYVVYASDDRDDLDKKTNNYGLGVKHSF